MIIPRNSPINYYLLLSINFLSLYPFASIHIPFKFRPFKITRYLADPIVSLRIYLPTYWLFKILLPLILTLLLDMILALTRHDFWSSTFLVIIIMRLFLRNFLPLIYDCYKLQKLFHINVNVKNDLIMIATTKNLLLFYCVLGNIYHIIFLFILHWNLRQWP